MSETAYRLHRRDMILRGCVIIGISALAGCGDPEDDPGEPGGDDI